MAASMAVADRKMQLLQQEEDEWRADVVARYVDATRVANPSDDGAVTTELWAASARTNPIRCMRRNGRRGAWALLPLQPADTTVARVGAASSQRLLQRLRWRCLRYIAIAQRRNDCIDVLVTLRRVSAAVEFDCVVCVLSNNHVIPSSTLLTYVIVALSLLL